MFNGDSCLFSVDSQNQELIYPKSGAVAVYPAGNVWTTFPDVKYRSDGNVYPPLKTVQVGAFLVEQYYLNMSPVPEGSSNNIAS